MDERGSNDLIDTVSPLPYSSKLLYKGIDEKGTRLTEFMETGKRGEKIVSAVLEKLRIPHKHNPFDDDYQYSIDDGSDLEGINTQFEIEVKNLSEKYKIIEEKDHKAKEYNCIIQIRSELGPINFLTHVKDKKKISETDLKKFLSNAQKIPLPAFFIHTGELSKKALEFAEKYYSILKSSIGCCYEPPKNVS